MPTTVTVRIEGPQKSGRSTIAGAIYNALRAAGFPVVLRDAPGEQPVVDPMDVQERSRGIIKEWRKDNSAVVVEVAPAVKVEAE